MKYCPTCAGNITFRIPENDDRERHICDACGEIHYQNPRIVVCSLPAYKEQVLLCKRAIEPRYGKWTLPGGFMENAETTRDAAIRETREEACAKIEIHGLYAYYNLPHINQVQMFYRATLVDTDFAAGPESLEVELFDEADIPWNEIAFPAVGNTLKQYFKDLPEQHFPVRTADIILAEDNRRIVKPIN